MCEACREFVQTMHGQEDKNEKLRAETELELARIKRDEAIQLAKIAQKMNEDDNEAELIAAEVATEVQADVIDQMTQPDETIIVAGTSEDADLDGEPIEPEEEFVEAPPEVEETAPVHTAPKSSFGYWPA